MKKLIDVYAYRMKGGIPEFLLFLRSAKKIYAHQWRMIGGKVEEGEKYWEAALRELREETGLQPHEFWTIPGAVKPSTKPKQIKYTISPAFAVSLDDEVIPELDDEHTEYRWISIDELDSYLSWPEQKRLIRLTYNLLVNDQILPEWRISIP